MKLFFDIFRGIKDGQEVISDGYPIKLEYEGVVGKVQSKMVVQGDVEVDIGCGNEFGGGGDQDQGGNPNVQKVNDIIDAFHYTEIGHDKNSFGKHFKQYMKKILKHLQDNKPDRVESFTKGAKQFFAYINEHFDDITFYAGKEDYEYENHIMISYYEEGAAAPIFCYIMDGLKEMKV